MNSNEFLLFEQQQFRFFSSKPQGNIGEGARFSRTTKSLVCRQGDFSLFNFFQLQFEPKMAARLRLEEREAN